MAASYIVKKADTYFFRHSLPATTRQHHGKREFIKSLKVSRKSEAIKISRELKIIFDLVMKKSEKNPLITWKEIRQTVDHAFDIIYQRYVRAVETHGPDFNDEYDPLKFIPPDYEQFIVLEDSTVDWNNIPELQDIADKIIKRKKLQISKDSKEYNLFCYRTAQMLHEHEYRKKTFRSNPPCYSHQDSYATDVLEQNDIQRKVEGTLLKEFFSTFWEESEGGWAEKTKKEYKGVYENLFSILEVSANKSCDELYIHELNHDLINKFFSNLLLFPSQFTKRFKDKISLNDALVYAKKLKKGEPVSGLDGKTKNNLQQSVSAATLNDKYINLMNMFLDYACQCGKLEKNPLKGRRVKSKVEVESFRPFSQVELETIFSEKEITDGRYFKYWMPILGLYTGARINELAQLRLKDIKNDNGIYYIDITDSEETTVKNSASRRHLVIHPNLIRIGFIQYIEWLNGKNEKFLFPEISNDERKGIPVSRWFSRLLDDCKICENDKKGKIGFHSFRNNISDQFKQKGAVDQFAAAQLGHKNEKISYDIYGSDIHLNVKYENLVQYVNYSGCKFPWEI
ncbi:MAG: tyrosine-type recombinase/integrase [Candidatus Electronema sp. V4]|uniref:tyrosine-type recombinase/integrase n=1 Tax=Candidatus Electronema sp. V4 TaxID=3454756 RepID=UPI0040558F82